ncbi:MAG: VOC family protein [Tatlockia sp.]|nr:VOC family protein [Tatlockia sp.]
MSQKNTFCWIDIPVLDLDRAIAFYSAVIGEPVTKFSEHGFEFGLLPHTDDNVSGCLCVMEDRKPSQDGPLVYLNTEGRIDQAIAEVEKQGCKVIAAKQQIGPYGHRAIFLDTEGNAIALYSKEA